eukprot:TRINITY_DN80332_c0_g1_i1.p2 TRINITY_DN80332_c0_g1~~TRINITY_DN80332_c0_g1_i1.p2  ORF type:complete len:107 (+),score=17.01 TRINITY_DN80332_c0_g1_i1:48-368(+)
MSCISRRLLSSACSVVGRRWTSTTVSAPPRSTMDKVPFDYGAVLSALTSYFDALHLRDPDMMRRVWHPSSHLKRVGGDGTLVDISAERFLEIVGESTGEQAAHQHQ